jgi:Ca2+-binding RTX toxin-like protein
MIAGSVTIYDGDDEDDNVSNTLTAYHRVDAVGWATEVLADLFAGTAGADRLNGTVTADTIHGDLGNDTLNGNDGDDTLDGNAGNDTLGGGAGADTMAGGGVNYSYFPDNVGDRVVETSATGGIDLVNSAVSFARGNYVENLALTGAAAINGIGNALANVLTGNVAANILNGGLGADTMTGGSGNDN